MEANSVFIPSCESRGAFASKQCQQGGQCWCVDPAGRELPGTRQHGDSLTCSECLSSVSKFFLHFFSFVSVSASVFRAPDALSRLSFLLLQVQVRLTAALSAVWLCPVSSLVPLSLLFRPPLVALQPPVSPSSSLSGTSSQWTLTPPLFCLSWSKSCMACSPLWAGLCRL